MCQNYCSCLYANSHFRSRGFSLAMQESLKRWLPAILLIIFLSVLIAAIRVYVGGPDGFEFVWKGGLSLDDTVVNVDDYANVPRKEMLRKPALLAQMEEMGLYLSPDTPVDLLRKRRAKKWRMKKNDETKSDTTPAASESGAATDTGSTETGAAAETGASTSCPGTAGSPPASAPTETPTSKKEQSSHPPLLNQ